jgi:hypothetical protein
VPRPQALDDAFEIGVASPELPTDPIPAALGNGFTVSDNLELTGPARRSHCVDVESPLDEGHETRDLGFVVLSRRAIDDFDLHTGLERDRTANPEPREPREPVEPVEPYSLNKTPTSTRTARRIGT